MGRLYTSKHKIKFTQITESYKVSRVFKSKISEMHSKIGLYVMAHYKDTKKYKQQIVDALNLITYSVYADDTVPTSWLFTSPFSTFPGLPEEKYLEEVLGDLLLTVDSIDWSELKPTDDSTIVYAENSEAVENSSLIDIKPDVPKQIKEPNLTVKNISSSVSLTPKQDLYIQPPSVPQFNYNKPWMKKADTFDNLVIYTTLPEIPTKQNEISVTTDVNMMTESDLMKLYPNHIIHTRASVMYEPLEGVELHPELGLLIPIEGYTRDQIIDNIIRYPHIFRLTRKFNDQIYSFYSHIEIEGELYGSLDIWNSLPESKLLPRHKEFVKEYIVRRYLLERDIKGIVHSYPIEGSLDAFLTLFMSSDTYIQYNYKDVVDIAKQCVKSRVSYKQSRNPVIRRMIGDV